MLATRQELRHAAELAVPIAKHIKPGEKVNATFLIEVAIDFPMLFTNEYKSKFGS